MKRAVLIALCLMLAVSACSCGTGGSSDNGGSKISSDTQNNAADSSETTAENTVSYDYPNVDFEGDAFTILNIEPIWDFYTYFDITEMTGEPLDDAVYKRNRYIEDVFNVILSETDVAMDSMVASIQKTVLAGDDTYDAAYVAGHQISPLISEGHLLNMLEIDGLNLNEVWWDQAIIDNSKINDSLYFALCDITLEGLQGAWVMYFNEDMTENLGLERPYSYVLDGTWTLDKLDEYLKAGSNLNGAESFAWDHDGTAIYGLLSFEACPAAMIIGCGEKYIDFDASGTPYFALDNERFYNVAQKIAAVLGEDGNYQNKNDSTKSEVYDNLFMNGRSYFMSGEVKAASLLRTMDDNYGILPYPKYDENQENYYDVLFQQLPLLCVPITNSNVEEAGILLDALAYQSYVDTMPIFYDITVSQKGLRNEESIGMLEIIRDSRFFDIGQSYGWTTTLYNSVRSVLDGGSAEVASVIAKNKESIESAITKTLESFSA